MTFSAIAGTDVRYRVEGQGQDIVLVHGLGGLFHSFRDVFPMLAERHRVWEIALPDFDSDTTHARLGNTPAHYAGDVLKLLDHAEIPRAVMVGNSLGGQAVAHLAARAPERVAAVALVSSSGLGEQQDGHSLFTPEAALRLLRNLGEDGVADIMRTIFTRDESFIAEVPAVTERLRKPRYKLGMLMTARHAKDATILPLLPHITAPTLMLWGGRDRITPVRYAKAAAPMLPNARLVVIDDVGHAPQIEAPRESFAALHGFLGELAEREG